MNNNSHNNKNEIMVSILCTCYNHEQYINQCLDSLIMQETNFKYEIIINDDSSTDNSANIIKHYQEQYPEIIKPIYQKTNQYSQGKNIYKSYLLPNAQGKYIAMCEGDDYWTHPYKLQKQYDTMKAHPEFGFCTHLVECKSEDLSKVVGYFPTITINTGIIYKDDFITNYFMDKWWFQLTSYFFKKNDLVQFYKNKDKIFGKSPVDDELMLMYFGCKWDTYYLNEKMSVYRRFSKGSWSSNNNNTKLQNLKKHKYDLIKVYKKFNKFTYYKYNKLIKKTIEHRYYDVAYFTNNEKLKLRKCKSLYTGTNTKNTIYLYAQAYIPNLLHKYQIIKKYFSK